MSMVKTHVCHDIVFSLTGVTRYTWAVPHDALRYKGVQTR